MKIQTAYLRKLFLVFSAFFAVSLSAQLSVAGLALPYGSHDVGYYHYTAYDSTRTYTRTQDWTNEKTARPIPISVWYPAEPEQPAGPQLTVFDYLKVLSIEEEWEHLPDDLIMSWFEFPNSPENQRRIKEVTKAILDAPMLDGKFPVVVYAASFLASSTENFALCEFLASHGFVVLASPGRGAESRPYLGSAVKNSEGQARDLEFLIQEAARLPVVDIDRLATLDYSFGGLATAIAQMRNARIKAMVSLDGRSRYDYATIFANPSADINRFDVPLLHLAQKVIPDPVLVADGIDPTLNTEFRLFDSLRYSTAHAVRFYDLSHRHFSTMGLLLKTKDPRQDRPDAPVMAAHRLMALFTLNFLRANLDEDEAAIEFLATEMVDGELISARKKSVPKQPFSFRDFNDLAADNDYEDLDSLYRNARLMHPEFSIPEWQLNSLGLQLGFRPDRVEEGVLLYRFALRQYPQSGNLHDSLAEVLLHGGQLEQAAYHFRKSLELSPGNENAKKRLEELGE